MNISAKRAHLIKSIEAVEKLNISVKEMCKSESSLWELGFEGLPSAAGIAMITLSNELPKIKKTLHQELGRVESELLKTFGDRV
jgi:hypothetical protein